MFSNFLGEVKGIFNVITLIDLVLALICILVGLLFFTGASASNALVSVITGFVLIANGASSIFAFFKRGRIDLYNNDLIFGGLLILLGVVAMFSGKILSIILGIYFLVGGLQKISYSVFLKKFNESSWIVVLGMGIMIAILGIVTFFTDGEAVIKVTGICLLGYGIFNLINAILFRRRAKYFIA